MKKLFGLVLFLLILPVNAYALTGSVKINCDETTINPGETVTCVLTGTISDSSDGVGGISLEFVPSSNLTLEKFTVDTSIWSDNKVVNNILAVTHKSSDFVNGTFNIGAVTLKANSSINTGSNETIKLSSIIFTDKSWSDNKVADVSQSIRIASTIDTLSSLTVSKGTLTPTFNKNTLNYSVSVEDSSIVINGVNEDKNAKVSGDVGTKTLKYGLNTFNIVVTSESGSKKTYTLSVTRPDNRSYDKTLSSLVIGNDEIELLDDVFEYTYRVDENVKTIKVEASTNDDKAYFAEGYDPGVITLTGDKTTITLKVIAENGTEQDYDITFIRGKDVVDDSDSKDNTTGDTSNANKGNTGSDKIENPKTGSLSLYIVIVIALLSVCGGIYFFKKKVQGNEAP